MDPMLIMALLQTVMGMSDQGAQAQAIKADQYRTALSTQMGLEASRAYSPYSRWTGRVPGMDRVYEQIPSARRIPEMGYGDPAQPGNRGTGLFNF